MNKNLNLKSIQIYIKIILPFPDNIVNGEYMISLSPWVWNIERNDLMDFVPILSETIILAITPKNPAMDIELFIRPFSDEAWKGIGLTFLAIIACIMGPYTFLKYYEFTDG